MCGTYIFIYLLFNVCQDYTKVLKASFWQLTLLIYLLFVRKLCNKNTPKSTCLNTGSLNTYYFVRCGGQRRVNYCTLLWQRANQSNSITCLSLLLHVTRDWQAICDAFQTPRARASYMRETQRRKTDSHSFCTTTRVLSGGGENAALAVLPPNAFYKRGAFAKPNACLTYYTDP